MSLTTRIQQALGRGEWPIIVSADIESNSALLELQVPEQLNVFDGHFPEQAVLPGILQVHWAAELGQTIFSEISDGLNKPNFTNLRGVKFNGMIMPKTDLELSLQFDGSTQKLKFEFRNPQQKFSSGSIEYSKRQT